MIKFEMPNKPKTCKGSQVLMGHVLQVKENGNLYLKIAIIEDNGITHWGYMPIMDSNTICARHSKIIDDIQCFDFGHITKITIE